jgi:hypothetical protein
MNIIYIMRLAGLNTEESNLIPINEEPVKEPP